MPAGSTPRIVASVIGLIATGIVVGGEIATPDGAARLGALAVTLLATGRLLTIGERWAALGSGAALALGLGALGGPPALLAAAVVAAGLGLIDGAEELSPAGTRG
jgi:hypothetical protein